jgi:hypothetical protein
MKNWIYHHSTGDRSYFVKHHSDCQVNCQYPIPLSSSLYNVTYTQKNNVVRGLVGGENNIFAMKRRQVFSNIWLLGDPKISGGEARYVYIVVILGGYRYSF